MMFLREVHHKKVVGQKCTGCGETLEDGLIIDARVSGYGHVIMNDDGSFHVEFTDDDMEYLTLDGLECANCGQEFNMEDV